MIQQPFDLSKEEFVKELIRISQTVNIDITYELMEDRGDYVKIKYGNKVVKTFYENF